MDRMSYSTYLIVSLCLLAILLPACTEPTDTLEVTAELVTPDEDQRLRELELARTEHLAALEEHATGLLNDGNREDALDVIEEMLEIDPQNSYALELHEPLKYLVVEQAEHDALKLAMIQWQDELIYPDDTWDRPRRQRPVEPEAETRRRVYQTLEKRYSRFEFEDVDVETVFNYFITVSGLSFDVRWDVLKEAGIEPTAMVNINLWDVKLEKAIRTTLEDVGGDVELAYEVGDDGVIVVSTKADIEDMSDDEEEAPAEGEPAAELDAPVAVEAPAEGSAGE